MDQLVIEETKAFKVKGVAYLSREEALRAALVLILNTDNKDNSKDYILSVPEAVDLMIIRRDEIVSLLTGTKPRKPRADRGKSHRKPQAPAEVKDSPEPGVLPGVKVESSSKYRNK